MGFQWLDKLFRRRPRNKVIPHSLASFLLETRKELGLSQAEFCATYELSLGELVAWEAGRSEPPPSVCAYLKVIRSMPLRVAITIHAPEDEASASAPMDDPWRARLAFSPRSQLKA